MTRAERIADRRVLRVRAVRSGGWPRLQVDLPPDPFALDPSPADATTRTGVAMGRVPTPHRESTTRERRPARAHHDLAGAAPVHPPAADGAAPPAAGPHSGSSAGTAPILAAEASPPPTSVAWDGLATATELPGLDVRTFVVADNRALPATLGAAPVTGPTGEPDTHDRAFIEAQDQHRPPASDGIAPRQAPAHAAPVPDALSSGLGRVRASTAAHGPGPSPLGPAREHPGGPARSSDPGATARRPGRDQPAPHDGPPGRTVPGTGEQVTAPRATDRPPPTDRDSPATAGASREEPPQRRGLDPSELSTLADAVARRLRDKEVLDRTRRGEVPWQR